MLEPILCFSSIDWDFIWQGHQEIMATLADRGHRVLYVENTGVRNLRMGDMGRIRQLFSNWRKNLQGFREERKNLFVYSPILLPFPYSRIAQRINRWLLLSALRRWMEATEFFHPICWTFLPTPLTLDLIRRIPHRLLVYYCIDSFADSTPAAQRIVPSERQLFREADLVFVTSHALREQAVQYNPRVHLFPFGVSLRTFQPSKGPETSPPAEAARCKRPIIGYVGGIHQWVDQELLCRMAQDYPDYSFLMVGPIQTDVERLRTCPNIVLTGQKPHKQLPDYVQQFDAGIIPYRLTEYTRNVYPTKLNEYLILGKPVVSTPLPEVLAFNERYGSLVRVASDPDAFGAALQAALHDCSLDVIRRRRETARENGWDRRIDSMEQIIEESLGKRTQEQGFWRTRFAASWQRSRRLVRWTAIGAVAFALLFETPLVWITAEPLRLPEQISSADVIVVFAGGVGESGQSGQGYQERVIRAVELYRQGLAPRMVFVSGYTWALQETEIMRALARDLRVPVSSIATVTSVRNTRDYVLEIKRIAQREHWHSILLVTSPYHMRRAKLTLVRNVPSLKVFPAPVSHSNFYSHRRGILPRQLQGILHEAIALLYYRWKGWA